MNGWLIYETEKTPRVQFGTYCSGGGYAYAEQFIQHDEYKHAVAIKDGKVKDIDNALVITTGNGSYGYPLQERVAS